MISEMKGEARRLWLAGREEKLGASPSLPATSHSIALPHSLAVLNRIVALGSFSPRSMHRELPTLLAFDRWWE
jgi:hypothetical protein